MHADIQDIYFVGNATIIKLITNMGKQENLLHCKINSTINNSSVNSLHMMAPSSQQDNTCIILRTINHIHNTLYFYLQL
jgi:hypothetical protein